MDRVFEGMAGEAQLAFELDACLNFAKLLLRPFSDPEVIERAGRAVAGILERARTIAANRVGTTS